MIFISLRKLLTILHRFDFVEIKVLIYKIRGHSFAESVLFDFFRNIVFSFCQWCIIASCFYAFYLFYLTLIYFTLPSFLKHQERSKGVFPAFFSCEKKASQRKNFIRHLAAELKVLPKKGNSYRKP